MTAATAAAMVDDLTPDDVRHALNEGKNHTPTKFIWDSDEDVYRLFD